MTYYIQLTANKRDYNLHAPKSETAEDSVTFLAQHDRVTTDGETRLTTGGDTRIVMVYETAYPFVLNANKRNYILYAPDLEVA